MLLYHYNASGNTGVPSLQPAKLTSLNKLHTAFKALTDRCLKQTSPNASILGLRVDS